jgi:two-component system, chemotaxis family, CheB/CheR fusion protein
MTREKPTKTPKDGSGDQEPHMPADPDPESNTKEITVVGMGASAGGLKALTTFFDALPAHMGMAYVVVTHLHPERESMMDELLQSHTPMPVLQVNELVVIEPDHVYIIPPNRNIVITDSHLETTAFDEPRGYRAPIDVFFRSLADVHRDAIAIILSGGGSDGAVGVKAIKEMGGMLMVQDPSEAEYDSMPLAAIATGLADVVLPARELAEKLVNYRRQPTELPHDPEALTADETETLNRILNQVHSQTGHDFSQYKRSTILRRIQRRMQLNGYAFLDAYLDYLRHNGDEAHALFSDLLIGVTNFFRDRGAWEALAEKVIPKLFKGKGAGSTVRVWTIGCATGEEAYSVAILLMEYATTLEVRPKLQIFASDLDEKALALGREGLYPQAIRDDVNSERLSRFFIKEGDYYRVKRELRDIVLFTDHSVLRDPPFSRLELISCRNLLIYLEREMQEKVFEIFHYALYAEGYLFLGSSESAETTGNLFHIVDKTERIYQSRPWRGEHPNLPTLPLMIRRMSHNMKAEVRFRAGRFPDLPYVLSGYHQEGLEEYGPPSILVDHEYHILHLSETVGRYLLNPRGPMTNELLKLVRPELQFELRATLFEAFEKNQAVVSSPVYVSFNGHPHRVVLSVRPRRRAERGQVPEETLERLALVFFLEDETDELPTPALRLHSESDGLQTSEQQRIDIVDQLQEEVQRLRERLQANIEEFESSNEELKSTNEELQSMNEEYRSTTEELETSKEELQSINEELNTVNNELKSKLEELLRLHKDLENLIFSTEIATLFLDRDLHIKWFTPGIETLFNIMSGDRGRPIAHLTNKLGYDRLAEDAAQVLRKLIPIERELRGPEKEWFLVRVRPYRTVDDRIDGVVITFIDITEIKENEWILRDREAALALAVEYRDKIVSGVREGLLVMNTELILQFANRSFYEKFKVSPENTIGKKIYELSNGEWNIPELRHLLEDLLPDQDAFNDYEITHDFETIGQCILLFNCRRLDDDQLILLVFDEITQQRRAMAALHDSEQQLRQLNETLEQQVEERTLELEEANSRLDQSSEVFSTLFQANPVPTALTRTSDGVLLDVNAEFLDYFGFERENLVGSPSREVQRSWSNESDRARLIERLQQDGYVRGMELGITHPSGEDRTVMASIELAQIQGEDVIISTFFDITTRVEAERKLQASSALLSSLFQANPVPTALTRAADGVFLDANDEFLDYFGFERENVIGRTSLEIHYSWAKESDREKLMARLQRDGYVRNLEVEYPHSSGENRTLLTSIQPVDIEGVKVLISAFTDITDRVQAEQQVRELASQLTMVEQNVRHNLAQVLHDDLQQRLYAIELQMTFLRDSVEKVDKKTLAVEFKNMKQEIDDAILLTRHLSVDLSPPILHDEGLKEAFGWLAEQMREQYNLKVKVQAAESFKIPEIEIRVLLFQSVRELLFNVVKHAETSEARVSLEWMDDSIRIQIADGGKGFDTETLKSQQGRGLSTMRHRLNLFDGDLEIQSEPGSGCQITVTAPVKR